MRATDEMVRTALIWARNYEEIRQFERIAPAGRKWKITLRAPALIGAVWTTGKPQEVVPDELVLTNREAMAFAYGCAVAGSAHPGRAEFARERWGWDSQSV